MTTTTALVPPHSLEAERSVLGAILLTGALALEAMAHEERLAADHFYRDQHALVYQAMLALHKRYEPIDTLTVTNQLAEHGVLEQVGGSLAVDELAGWVPAAGHARAYARIVRDHATRRQLLHASYEIQQHALAGLQTGIAQIDEALKGMRSGELIILAARPSQGKSVLAQQIATHNALHGNATVMFSLEQPLRASVRNLTLAEAARQRAPDPGTCRRAALARS